jgi:glycosyltransferase involved in cell wall biosynthesis
MLEMKKQIHTLQMGNDWFAERQGGLNRVYSELLRHLPAANVRVHGLVAGSPEISAQTGGVVEGFASPSQPLSQRLRAVRRTAASCLEREPYDLIASHFALYAFPLLDKLKTRPTVIHFHGPWAAEAGVEGRSSFASRIQSSIERAVYARGDRFIVLSHAFAGELISRYRVPESKVFVVPGGIDSHHFHDGFTRAEARERLGWPQGRPIVLAVRRQMRRMGLENLIDATAEVRRAVPEVLVMLAGTGPLVPELRGRIVGLGLEDHVRQLGRLPDEALPLAYRGANLSIVPTQALEGFGMITLESLASGTPVLVTPVGGLPEVLAPFAPECILAGTSTEAMRDALTDFLKGTQPLPRSEACREYAVTNFAWPVIAAKVRNVYEGLLQ